MFDTKDMLTPVIKSKYRNRKGYGNSLSVSFNRGIIPNRNSLCPNGHECFPNTEWLGKEPKTEYKCAVCD